VSILIKEALSLRLFNRFKKKLMQKMQLIFSSGKRPTDRMLSYRKEWKNGTASIVVGRDAAQTPSHFSVRSSTPDATTCKGPKVAFHTKYHFVKITNSVISI